MSDTFDELKTRYPWPEEKPDVPTAFYDHWPHGWLCGENVAAFERFTPDGGLAVELGSWMGRSATAFMERTKCETLCCIDHWHGSAEHHINPDWAAYLPKLFETFCVNVWHHRRRIIPMRTNTILGMEDIARTGAKPDVIYVDAAHDPDSVARDLSNARRLFPGARIIGDDWLHATVKEGIARVVPLSDVNVEGVCWWL